MGGAAGSAVNYTSAVYQSKVTNLAVLVFLSCLIIPQLLALGLSNFKLSDSELWNHAAINMNYTCEKMRNLTEHLPGLFNGQIQSLFGFMSNHTSI